MDLQWHSIESCGVALRQTPEEDILKTKKIKLMNRFETVLSQVITNKIRDQ